MFVTKAEADLHRELVEVKADLMQQVENVMNEDKASKGQDQV